ncbi:MAG TPA: glycoside hydrolase family 15 protein [Polyangia bacterium]|jgi:GH15 family glucan-1,4-alpha-glucosidase|nr:glycoside hydrolase family 15 protein [Polyangia bacterium]
MTRPPVDESSAETPGRIEDYAIIGDSQTAALVGRNGSIDWLCLPRFDSEAAFAALLGNRDHGRWLIAPRDRVRSVRRRYRQDSLVLETEMTTAQGVVRIVDFMPIRDGLPNLIRVVEGLVGQVAMGFDLVVRFDTGRVTPWVRRREGTLTLTAGPDALCLRSDIAVHGKDLSTVGHFDIAAGQRRVAALTWFPSHQPLPPSVDPLAALAETDQWWRSWSSRCTYDGPWKEAVGSSLRVLKALTFGPTGGIVAAPTTSLPEKIGGMRNWDYRYCWLRDATLTLYALMLGGYVEEAEAWREWLLRAAAGDPSRLQIMYGVAGERRLEEHEAHWLPGFAESRPVRIGNAAYGQLQLDVFGEISDALHQARRLGIAADPWAWSLEKTLLEFLETRWRQPDHGIWEVRGPKQHFTHSKIMAWVAFDRAIKAVDNFGLKGPSDRWRAIRSEIHSQVCAQGYDQKGKTFTQTYGATAMDASLLLVSLVGFLPPDDPRVAATVEAVERQLLHDGFVRRYLTDDDQTAADGMPPGEGVFLPCSFWLADVYEQLGRHDDAVRLFERLLNLRNDVGLLSEQYDPQANRLLGNFPQAFSHLSLVNTAYNLTAGRQRPARHRAGEES